MFGIQEQIISKAKSRHWEPTSMGLGFQSQWEKALKIDRQNGNHRQGDAIERKQELHRQSRKESHQRSQKWKGFEVDWIPGDCLSPRLWRKSGSDLTGMLLQWE